MGDITLRIAKQIEKHRKKIGMNKKELSAAVGVAPSTVSGWENGDYAPGADTLVKLCDLFDITLDEIYGINEKAPGISSEGNKYEKYLDIFDMLEELPEEQRIEIRGYIKHLVYEHKAAQATEAAKQINGVG